MRETLYTDTYNQQLERRTGQKTALYMDERNGINMEGVIYYSIIRDEYRGKNLEHMIAEKLLAEGLKREYGKELEYEPRSKGEHGKPFFTLAPDIHYNISHSGRYVMCIFAPESVGIDVQEHRKVNYKRMLERIVPPPMVREILSSDDLDKAFFTQWVLREAFIKWTGEGLSRDVRTIPMDQGNYILLDLEPGYSAAVWSADPLELRMEHVDIIL